MTRFSESECRPQDVDDNIFFEFGAIFVASLGGAPDADADADNATDVDDNGGGGDEIIVISRG